MPNENAEGALRRLKKDSNNIQRIVTKKRNIRKRKKTSEDTEQETRESPQSSLNNKIFQHLMKIIQRLQILKYSDVYIDTKETIQFELHQIELRKKKFQEQKELQQNGWHYKIEFLDGVEEPKHFGPFKLEQMEEWRQGGFFKESESKI